jgi:citrate synthase
VGFSNYFFLQISTGKNDKGLKLYDPGYLNTAPVRSTISYIDGDEGILRYRGYPIEELAEKSTFMEVSDLISASSFYSKYVYVVLFMRHMHLGSTCAYY